MTYTFLVHIGPHKTGSTYLQRYVFPSIHGIKYLGRNSIDKTLGVDTYSLLMKWLCNNDEKSYKEFVRLIKTYVNDTILISDEWLSSYYSGGYYRPCRWKEKIDRLARLKELGEIKILFYRRSPAEALFSLFREFLANGVINDKTSIDDFIQSEEASFYYYRSTEEYLAEIYGDNNIHMIRYNDIGFNSRDLSKFLGVNVNSASLCKPHENKSLKAEYGYIMNANPMPVSVMLTFLRRYFPYLKSFRVLRRLNNIFKNKYKNKIYLNELSKSKIDMINKKFDW